MISRNLRALLSNKPNGADVRGGLDRIDILWGESRSIHENPDDRIVLDDPQGIKDAQHELFDRPEIRQARDYLVQSPDFMWLLSKIRSMTKTMCTVSKNEEVRQKLVDLIRGGDSVQMQLDWHFSAFAEKQYDRPEAVELQQVLCCSGLADNAFVGTSIEYADMLWPRLGRETVACLSKSLLRGSVKMSGK